MAKGTHLGAAPPDDPIFSSGPQVFVPMSRRSTKDSTKNTAGTSKSQKPQNPMQSAADQVEEFGMEQARKNMASPTTGSTAPGKDEKK